MASLLTNNNNNNNNDDESKGGDDDSNDIEFLREHTKSQEIEIQARRGGSFLLLLLLMSLLGSVVAAGDKDEYEVDWLIDRLRDRPEFAATLVHTGAAPGPGADLGFNILRLSNRLVTREFAFGGPNSAAFGTWDVFNHSCSTFDIRPI